ncbi:Cystatin-A1 Stefin-A1 [Channa argus]|uniref:Cystatin-B n=1 Tax=Channa argus TaxID=215402 RepID=A0A6G1QMT3_CHAAH|nr:Cystatin-A1 Stefin-A1 [Channa argus]KAK2886508.1 hypothetical protein Q8A73_020454 [Channa argus]
MALVPGGWSEVKHATAEIQKYCDQVKKQIQEKTNHKFEHFKAEKFKSQTVKGTNYLIKIHVKGTSYIHVKLYHKLPCDGGTVEVSGVQENHTKDDPLVSF